MDADRRVWRERGLREAVLAGEEAAWRVLYEEHFRPFYAYIHVRAGRRADRTEEVVGESWMIAVRRIRRFDPARGSFGSWLRGIGNHVLRNHRRRWRRERRIRGATPGGSPPADSLSADVDRERRIEMAEKIARVFAGLPERYRAVLQARYEAHLAVKDIAARWGESAKAIESLLSRARAAFRRAYARRDEEP